MSELTAIKAGCHLLKINHLQNRKKLLELGAGGDVHDFDFARVVGIRGWNEHTV